MCGSTNRSTPPNSPDSVTDSASAMNAADHAITQESLHRVIVRRQRGNFLAAPLHFPIFPVHIHHHHPFSAKQTTFVESAICASSSPTVFVWLGNIKLGWTSATG